MPRITVCDMNEFAVRIWLNGPMDKTLGKFNVCLGGYLWLGGNILNGNTGPFATFERMKKGEEWIDKVVMKKDLKDQLREAVMVEYAKARAEAPKEVDPFTGTGDDDTPF